MKTFVDLKEFSFGHLWNATHTSLLFCITYEYIHNIEYTFYDLIICDNLIINQKFTNLFYFPILVVIQAIW